MMKHIAKGFALAVSMLTTLPFFKVHDFYKGINGYAVMFYPVVGFLLGTILYGTYLLLEAHTSETHAAVIVFALWVVLSGALHLDGLSDTIDGLFVPKERALEVMKDPHTGGMGMIFSVVFLILKAATLAALDAIYLLPFIMMLARFNAVLAIYNYPYVSPNGMSALAKDEFTTPQLRVVLGYVFVVSFIFSWTLLFVSLGVLFVLKTFFMRRYGGFSGDIYGFSIEMTEMVLLNAIVFGVLL